MGETINWGVPNSGRTRKEEKFDTPVVTLAAILKDGAGRKFSFNKAAVEALGLVKPEEDSATYVAFGFNGDDLFCKSSVTEEDNMFKTNKSFSFSDKKTFEYIVKKKGLSIDVENDLHLEEVEGAGMFKVTCSTAETIIEDKPSEEVADAEMKEMQTEEVIEEKEAEEVEGTGNEVFSAAGEEADEEEVETEAVDSDDSESTEEVW